MFRQAASSKIITNAHMIRQGQMPDLRSAEPSSDFHFIERDTPVEIAATLVKLVQDRIPKGHQLDPIRDIQVLCPMNRGSIGVRKSQGSEFPAVVIPVAMQHYMLLQRNLIYTGITRAKRLLVVVGQKKALGLAVRNDQARKRYSGLPNSMKAPSV